MDRIELFLFLQLPEGKSGADENIRAAVEAVHGIEQVMLGGKPGEGIWELQCCYDGADTIGVEAIDSIKRQGAQIAKSTLMLSSSLTGISDEYDARDAGSEIAELLKQIVGVKEAAVGGRSTHLEFRTDDFASLMQEVRAVLEGLRNK